MKQNAARFLVCCAFLFLLCCHKQAPQVPADFFAFQLALSNDSRLNFDTLRKNKASVFVFLAPDCPQSQSYIPTLNDLDARFRNSNIDFYGVVTGDKYQRREIDGFISRYRVGIPIVLDPEASLARLFQAMVTPEAFVVGSDGIAVYEGAIDNWVPELGQHRTVITEHYLLDALNSFLQTGKVSLNKTKAVGCFIELGN